MRATRHLRKSGRRNSAAAATLTVAAITLATAACDGADDRQLFDISATGAIEATFFIDLDLDGSPGSGDILLEGRNLAFMFDGVTDTVATAATGAGGVAFADGLPVGAYRIEVPAAILGDSLRVSSHLPRPIEVLPGETATADVAVSFHERSIAEARTAPIGWRIFVEGVALNNTGSLPGNALHVRAPDGSIRGTSASGAPVAAGDTVRLLGHVARTGGSTRLESIRVVRLSTSTTIPSPEAVAVTTVAATDAGGGALDGDLVAVSAAQVVQAATVDGVVTARIDDGSGELFARIPTAHLAEAGLPTPAPGAVMSLTGVLVAAQGGQSWELWTRSSDDIEIDARGTIEGMVFVDANGTDAFNQGDSPLAGARLRLRANNAAGPIVAEAESGATGQLTFGTLPVGTYHVEVLPGTYPDSFSVRNIAPSPITLSIGQTVSLQVAIGFPTVSPAEARALPAGSGVFVRGAALNRPLDFGDGSLHLYASAAAIRVVDVLPPAVQPGDLLRVRGRIMIVNGQPILDGGQPFIEGTTGVPAPVLLSSGEAATASGGIRDAQLVQVRDATVTAISSADDIWRVTLNDGSGPVVVRVRLAGVDLTPETAAEFIAVDEAVTVRGLLVPTPTGGVWELRPRFAADLEATP